MTLSKQQSSQTPKASSIIQLQEHLTVHLLSHPTSDAYGGEHERCILKLTMPLKAYKTQKKLDTEIQRKE
jgi:hypothetical protein